MVEFEKEIIPKDKEQDISTTKEPVKEEKRELTNKEIIESMKKEIQLLKEQEEIEDLYRERERLKKQIESKKYNEIKDGLNSFTKILGNVLEGIPALDTKLQPISGKKK